MSASGRDRAEVEGFARTAHEEVFPYSRTTRGDVEVELKVV